MSAGPRNRSCCEGFVTQPTVDSRRRTEAEMTTRRRFLPTTFLFAWLVAAVSPLVGQSLTLGDALARAEASSPSIDEAQAGVAAARGRAVQAGVLPNPELQVGDPPLRALRARSAAAQAGAARFAPRPPRYAWPAFEQTVGVSDITGRRGSGGRTRPTTRRSSSAFRCRSHSATVIGAASRRRASRNRQPKRGLPRRASDRAPRRGRAPSSFPPKPSSRSAAGTPSLWRQR